MQLQGLLMMLFVMIIIPIVVLSSNHTAFFVIVSAVLLVTSIRNIHSILFAVRGKPSEDNEAAAEEFELAYGLDVKKFGLGTRVVRTLITLLFLFYCMFFIHTPLFKSVILLLITCKLFELLSIELSVKGSRFLSHSPMLRNIYGLFTHSLHIVVIVVSLCNRFVRILF